MNNLEEQIKYMQQEVDWYQEKVRSGKDGWQPTLDSCKAILASLENMKNEQAAKTTEGFEDWWYNYGSAILPLPGQDHEEHGRRIAQITWETATLHAREKP
jgi:hypothetical protein